MNSLQRYIAHIAKHSLARSNRFQVIVPLPLAMQREVSASSQSRTSNFFNNEVVKLVTSYLGGGATEVTRGLELMVEQSELPGKNLTTADIQYNGEFYKMPYSVVYAAQQFTFNVSQDMYEKNIIDEWMNLIYDPVTHEIGYMDDYAVNITVNQLDQADNVVHSVVLRDAFPMNTNPLILSNAETNMPHRLMCMFLYRRWERIGENESSPSKYAKLSQTALGPYVTPILSNPAVQKALAVFERETGVNLEGEAVAIYNQLNDIAENTTGSSINKSVSVIESIRATTLNNDKLSSVQKASILTIIDDLLTNLRG